MKEDQTQKIKKNIIIVGTIIIFIVLFILIISYLNIEVRSSIGDSKNNERKDFEYLSNIHYIESQSNVGWGTIRIDENVDGSDLISLIVDGKKKYFLKGIGAHATSNVVFDISGYDYDYFSTYFGVDASRGTTSDGVKIVIYTSVDGESWTLESEVSPPVSKGDTEARYIEINIKDKKYIKLHCRQYGSATADHCVYAGAKLYKEGYIEEEPQKLDFIKTLDEYDAILKDLTLEEQLNEKELILLQREFVRRVGYDTLQTLASLDKTYADTIRWLVSDVDNLSLYIHGGYPTGSYINSLKELSRLYTNFKEDFNITKISKYGNKTGDLYKRMAITLSLTHSSKVALWMQPSEPTNQSDALTRYGIFKKMYNEGKFVVNDNIDITEWFETYKVEEMRFIMNNIIDDESILWLNDYTKKQIDAHPNQVWAYLTPHPYMAYVWPNYGNEVFHDPLRKEYWDKLYDGIFSKYGVTYSNGSHKVYKVWMNFRNEFGTGAVCGGISKTGSNIRTVHGIPAAVIGQPGHAAIIYYNRNSNGQGYWGIDNDVSGWTKSEKSERMLLGWGNDTRYVRGYNVPYIVMGQEALNRFDDYQKSAEIIMLSHIYAQDSKKREEYLWSSLNELDFNVDAWYELINLYNNDNSKTEKDYYYLANKMSESLLEYPLPYHNLMALISPHLASSEYKFKYTLLLEDTLTKGKNYNGTDVLQPGITRGIAAYLLGQTDTSLASFSFDGENKEKIVLSSKFDNSGIRWDYSLDGKETWNEVSFTADEEHKYQLTKDQINSITAENDIYVHIVGAPYDDENTLKIDITENIIKDSSYFRNDLENRIIGINLLHEWRNNENDPWTSYAVKSPDNTGNKTLQIRVSPNGTKLASNILTFNFTEDKSPDSRKYVPVSHLSIHAVSTEAVNQNGSAIYAIDGNYNSRWHSAWNGTDTERYITIKLDQPMAISAVEFVPAGGGNGKIYDGSIYGSMDGENWELLARKTNLTYTNQANTNEDAIKNTKSFDIENPIQVKYVKIVADRTNGNWFTARAFNFYEDFTKNPNPTASIGFDITSPTNGNVVARLINPSTEIRITNNNGKDTYTFTENGDFTFEFIDDSNGMTGSATASVRWIDKTPPTGTIRYSTTSKTNKEVEAILIPSEDIIVTNNGNYESDNPNSDPMTHLFMENGEFTFEFKDVAGNKGTASAKVDWIDTQVPNSYLTYSTMDLTPENVTVSISFDKENVKVTNNEGKTEYTFENNGEFTFEYVDEAGNIGTRKAYVNWIDKVAPNVYIDYSTTKQTTSPVTVTITSDEEIIITNNNGSNTYTFTENGDFDFTYEDLLGNKGRVTVSVNWIVKTNPSNPSNPTEPENPVNPGNNNPSNDNNEVNPGENNPNPKEEYIEFSLDKIKVSVLKNNLQDKLILKENEYLVPNAILDRFGKNSRYFELHLENENKEKVNITSKLKMTLILDENKEFLGIYEIRRNEAKELKYNQINKNTIEIETINLGKYAIHYKELIKEKAEEPQKSNNIIYIILGTILTLGVAGYIITIKKSKIKTKEELEKSVK